MGILQLFNNRMRRLCFCSSSVVVGTSELDIDSIVGSSSNFVTFTDESTRWCHFLELYQQLALTGNDDVLAEREDHEIDYYSNNILPDDILMEILSVLPVDVLPQLKRVCWQWRNVITSSDFVNLLLERVGEVDNVIFIECNFYIDFVGQKVQWSLFDSRQRDPTYMDVLIECDTMEKECLLRGSCGGLLVFSDNSKVSVVNNITKEIRVIKSPPSRGGSGGYVCGFFYDRFENEYTILYVEILTEHVYYTFGLSKSVWRRLDLKMPSFCRPSLAPPAAVDDSLYWIAKFSGCCTKTIIVFKIETKEFYIMPHPHEKGLGCAPTEFRVAFTHAKLMQLVVKNGKLCFCHTLFYEKIIDLWILEDSANWGSWVKKYKVYLPRVDKRFRLIEYSNDYVDYCLESVRIFSTQVGRGSDVILFTWANLFNWRNNGLWEYNLETHFNRQLKTSISDSESKSGYYVAVPHTKTLLSPFFNV